MLVMAVVFCAGTFGLNFQMTTALMATEVYGKGAGEYGILGSVHRHRFALGLIDGRQAGGRRASASSSAPPWCSGSSVTVVGLMPSYLTFAAFLPLCGFSALTLLTAANSFVQLAADPHMRGRVDGAVHGGLHGRHARRRADTRLGGRALRRPLDPDRRWCADRDRHDHRGRSRSADARASSSRRACDPARTSMSSLREVAFVTETVAA